MLCFLAPVQLYAVWPARGMKPRPYGFAVQLVLAASVLCSRPVYAAGTTKHVCSLPVHCRLKFPLRRMWLLVMVANSSYSFYWDVEQDWDMPWLTQYGKRRTTSLVAGTRCRRYPTDRLAIRATGTHGSLLYPTVKCHT